MAERYQIQIRLDLTFVICTLQIHIKFQAWHVTDTALLIISHSIIGEYRQDGVHDSLHPGA